MRGAGLLVLVGGLCLSSVVRAELGEDGFVLHNQVSPDVFTRLLLWDHPRREWRVARAGEQPGQTAPILVVHLWADWCKPCREEFPILRELAEQVEGAHPGKVQFLYLSQTQGQAEMQSFLFKYRARMPKAPIYQNTALGEFLLRQLSRTGLPLPITLILDERRVVRSVLIGSVARHRGYVAGTVARLVALSQGSSQP
jgi:thiol-disulfide isomerase/thioredoxin